MLAESLSVVVVPMEVSIDDQWNLHVAWYGVAVDRLVVRVVYVVHFDLVLREVVFIDTRLHSHRIFTNISTIAVLDRILRQSLGCDRMLVNKLGRCHAFWFSIADQLTEVFRAEFRLNLAIA